MHDAASDPFMFATDLVEYLVCKSVPFRQAHEAVSALVSYAREVGTPLPSLPLSTYRQFAREFDADVLGLFDPSRSAAAKISPGGTGSVPLHKAKGKQVTKS
jgi:argininosuccinate lyase